MVYEEGISEVEAISNLLVPRRNKIILAQKPQIVTKKIRMYCTNCYKTNHNVETCIIKRKENLVFIAFEITIQHIKV